MNQLTFRMAWHDLTEDVCEIACEAAGDQASILTGFSVEDHQLRRLAEELAAFAEGRSSAFSWSNGPDGAFRLSGETADRAGHLRLEVDAVVDGDPDHRCRFYMTHAEPGPLARFAHRLRDLEEGRTLRLYDGDL